jgi:hypothetical protein
MAADWQCQGSGAHPVEREAVRDCKQGRSRIRNRKPRLFGDQHHIWRGAQRGQACKPLREL